MTNPQTPLSEADPKSLDELYNADPLDLTIDDVDRLVADLRENRVLWAKEEAEAQSQGRARRPKNYKPKVPKGTLKLTDLNIGSLNLEKPKDD